jgi:hypothetical protein
MDGSVATGHPINFEQPSPAVVLQSADCMLYHLFFNCIQDPAIVDNLMYMKKKYMLDCSMVKTWKLGRFKPS